MTTETTETTGSSETTTTEPTPGDESATDPPAGDADKGSKIENEAAKYRRRLRDTEAERDTLRDQLDATRRGVVDQYVSSKGITPAALWAVGTDLNQLLSESGAVDLAKIDEAVTSAKATLGIGGPRPNPQQGKPSEGPSRSDSWSQLLNPNTGG